MQIIETYHHNKTETRHPMRVKTGRPNNRAVAWRPQPSSLTRDELRKIVLDTIG